MAQVAAALPKLKDGVRSTVKQVDLIDKTLQKNFGPQIMTS